MKHNLTAKLLVAVLAFAQMFVSFQPVLAAGERDVMALTLPLVTITGASFKAYSSGTTEVSNYNNIPQNASIEIEYAFRVEDATNPLDDVKGGDYFSVALPASLTNIASFVPVIASALTIDWNSQTYTIGYLDISASGIATITFGADIESLSDVTASFTIAGSLIDANIGNDSGISFQLWAQGSTYTIDFEDDPLPPVEPDATIQKTGVYSAVNNEITWTITVDCGASDASLDNVIVVDTIGASQTFKSTSVAPGNVSINTDGNYELTLGSITGTTSFTVKTTPSDGAFGAEGSAKTLTNQVDLYGNGFEDSLYTTSANVTVTTDWVRKSGTARNVSGVYYIDWTITLNNNRTIPAGSTVTDTLPGYLQVDLATVMRNGSLPASFGDAVDLTGQAFTYTFAADASGVQTITFTTRVLSEYFTQQNQTAFANTAVLHIGADTYSATSGNVGVGTSLIAKQGIGYDAATQLISWRIEVNRNAQAITAATVTDTLGANQQFDESFGVTRRDGSTTVNLTRVDTLAEVALSVNQYYYDISTRVLSVYLGNLATTDHPYLTFQTQVTNPNNYANNNTSAYTNTSAVLVGGGIVQSTVNNASQSATSLVLAKISSGYNYASKTISWTITVNQNNMSMPNAVATELVQPGQQYVDGSLLINGGEPGSMLSVSGDTLTITLGAITSQTVITFDTVITDLSVFLSTNGNVTFRNNASLSTGIQNAPIVSVWANRIVTNTPVSKNLNEEYIPANGYIGWEAFVNPNQALMQNASLTDNLQNGLELDTESIKLYYWNQNADGSMIVGGVVPESAYHFTYDYSSRQFVISLPNGAQGYYLVFKTDVLSAGTYSNTIAFDGSYNGSDNASSAYNVTTSDIAVAGTGWNGSITVTKTDEDGVPITTPTVFELLDSMRNVKATLTTNACGQVVFEKLKLRTYYIREKTAPLGYNLDSTEFEVTISGANAQTLNQSLQVSNDPLTASITLFKTDKVGKALTGGRFSVYLASDTTFKTPLQSVAANNGVIQFTGLEAGDYVVREIAAPAGYKVWESDVVVSLILNTQTNTLPNAVLTEPFIDEEGYGSIVLMKVDKSNAPLAGAEFGLFLRGYLIETAKSDNRGMVYFLSMPFGTYTIHEISAPKGYALSEETAVVRVTSTDFNYAYPYVFVNGPIPVGAPQTGDLCIPLGLFLMAASLVVFLAAKCKSRKY